MNIINECNTIANQLLKYYVKSGALQNFEYLIPFGIITNLRFYLIFLIKTF